MGRWQKMRKILKYDKHGIAVPEPINLIGKKIETNDAREISSKDYYTYHALPRLWHNEPFGERDVFLFYGSDQLVCRMKTFDNKWKKGKCLY